MRVLRYTLAASAACGIAMYVFVGPLVKRFGANVVYAGGVFLYGAMYLGMGLAQSRWATGVIFCLPLYGLTNVSANTLVAEYSTSEQRGGGLGVLNGTLALSTIAGPLTAGALADRVGLGVVPWVAFTFAILALPIALWIARNGRAPAPALQES